LTWAKYGGEYSDEIAHAGLSDAAYRTHTEAIGYVYRVEDLKLRIPKHVIRRFAGSENYELAIKELGEAGFWRDRGQHWEIVHHADVIRSGITTQQQKRIRDKNAQRAHRKRATASREATEVSDDVSADVSAESVTESAETQTVRQTSLHTAATYGRRLTA
jgi:hypothetical protein